MATVKRDSLGRIRRPAQDKILARQKRPGYVSRSHHIYMTEEAHEAFAKLSGEKRGWIIMDSIISSRDEGEE